MSKAALLDALFRDSRIDQMLAKFNAGGGQDDLKSELFATLCEKDEDFLINLQNKGQLLFYATAIVQRMVYQVGGRFHRRYRSACYEVSENMLMEATDEKREDSLAKLDAAIKNDLHWVEQEMLRIYSTQGNIERTAKQTQISKRQVHRILSNAKNKIKTSMSGKLVGNFVVANCEIIIDVPESVSPENINDILEEVVDFIKLKSQGKAIPSKIARNSFIKDISDLKLKRII